MKKFALIVFVLLTALWLSAHDHKHQQQAQASAGDLNDATESMSHEHHHQMGPHMHMSALHDPQPGDQERAEKVVEQARQALEKYKDYNAALDDGYKIFLPNVPQKMYHFTNWNYALGAAFGFDESVPRLRQLSEHRSVDDRGADRTRRQRHKLVGLAQRR